MKEVVKPFSIHSPYNGSVVHEAMVGGNRHAHRDVSPTFPTDLTVTSLSYSGSPMRSCCPYIVATFVYKHAMAHYRMVHEPVSVFHSLLYHVRSVSISGHGSGEFDTKYTFCRSLPRNTHTFAPNI